MIQIDGGLTPIGRLHLPEQCSAFLHAHGAQLLHLRAGLLPLYVGHAAPAVAVATETFDLARLLLDEDAQPIDQGAPLFGLEVVDPVDPLAQRPTLPPRELRHSAQEHQALDRRERVGQGAFESTQAAARPATVLG